MKELYTIGETAALLGVSTQTLRFYDRKDILKPVHIDELTGYRYYSYKQFHIVDRIKYLQGFGLTLEDILPIIRDGTTEMLLPALEQRKAVLLDEIQNSVDQIKDIDWYIKYFKFAESTGTDTFYRIHESRRYVLEVPCFNEDELSDMEIRLAKKKAEEPYRGLSYRRQYGYRIQMSDLLQQKFRPDTYFIYTKTAPSAANPDIKVIPEGDYVCFRTPILREKWNPEALRAYFGGNSMTGLILALEYEDNLVDWSDAIYEVQVQIR